MKKYKKINMKSFFEKREKLFAKQKTERGFSDEELWSLDVTISKFVLPRLIAFKNMSIKRSVPYGKKQTEWEKEINKMIYAFKKCSDERCPIYPEKETNKIQEGLDLFAINFRSLWD